MNETPGSITDAGKETKTLCNPKAVYKACSLHSAQSCQAVVAHTFNPSTGEAEAGDLSEFKGSLVYRVSFWTARATQRNPVSEGKNTSQGAASIPVLRWFSV